MEKKLYEKFLKGLKRKKFKVEFFDTWIEINKPADYDPYASDAKRLVPIIFEVEEEFNARIYCYDLPSAKYVLNFLKKHNIEFRPSFWAHTIFFVELHEERPIREAMLEEFEKIIDSLDELDLRMFKHFQLIDLLRKQRLTIYEDILRHEILEKLKEKEKALKN